MSTVGVVLDGDMQLLGHTPHTFPLIVADGLQWKGGKGQTECARTNAQAVVLVKGLVMGVSFGCYVGPELIESEMLTPWELYKAI